MVVGGTPKLDKEEVVVLAPLEGNDGVEGEALDELEECLNNITGRYQLVALLALGLANAADSTELMVISFIMPKLDFDDTMKGILSGSMFFGMLVGGMLAGNLADQIGRKPCLLVSMWVNFAFGLLIVVFPNSWQWIFFCRILTGVGVGGTVPVMFTMAAEITGLNYRGKFITIICSFWMFGGVYTAGVAWWIIGRNDHSWTWVSVASQIPNLIAIILIHLFMYETPRYCVHKGDTARATVILEKIARFNGKPFVNPFTEATRRLSTTATAKPTLKESWKLLNDLFKQGYGKTTLLLIVTWFTLSYGWYGIILWIPKLFDEYDAGLDDYQNTFLVQAANLPGNIMSAVLVDRLGRKRMLCYSMGLSCIVCVCMGFQNSLYPIVGLACGYNAVSIIGWNSLSCLSSESFPTEYRSTAVGVLSATGRVASGLSQLAFGLLFHYSVHVSIILFMAAGMMGAGSLAAYCLPFEPALQKKSDIVVNDEDEEFTP
eukprot:TRINITY_DN2905_c0_g2_i2.p1 TRINITY_DN2905_c0_g2~~TRINITY_DN2905_c0_g2_i2.p1  ORF type:complete len:501 (+),score=60.34 TRINITY_DN2905_c0_g2_i2:39-1505(+)